jgi:CRP-like cAMP-binding protein
MKKQLNYLSKTQFVSCLSNEQVSLLFDKIKDNVKDYYKTYEAGEYLFRENESSSAGLFLIKEGDVKVLQFENITFVTQLMDSTQVFSTDANGDQEISTHYRANESLGAFDIIDKRGRCVSALAVTKTRVTVLSHHMFTVFCAEHPIVLCHYITDVIARFWRLASFTLNTFLEIRDQSPRQLDVIEVACCIKERLYDAALTRKVFKCGSVVDIGLDANSDYDSSVLIPSPSSSMFFYNLRTDISRSFFCI